MRIFVTVNANIALVGNMTQNYAQKIVKKKKKKIEAIKKAKKMAKSPKANFNLTLAEGYENSSDDSKTSTYKERSPAKVPGPNMLANSSSSYIPLEHGSSHITKG